MMREVLLILKRIGNGFEVLESFIMKWFFVFCGVNVSLDEVNLMNKGMKVVPRGGLMVLEEPVASSVCMSPVVVFCSKESDLFSFANVYEISSGFIRSAQEIFPSLEVDIPENYVTSKNVVNKSLEILGEDVGKIEAKIVLWNKADYRKIEKGLKENGVNRKEIHLGFPYFQKDVVFNPKTKTLSIEYKEDIKKYVSDNVVF